MRRLFFMLLAFGCLHKSQAQVVIFPTGTTTNWILNIPTNQAVQAYWSGAAMYLKKDGVEVKLPGTAQPYRNMTMQGPAEIILRATNATESSFVSYRTLPSQDLITIVHQGPGNLEVVVPDGKIMKFVSGCATTSPEPTFYFKNADGTKTSSISWLSMDKFFLRGPITFGLWDAFAENSQFLTYYFIDEVLELPDGAMQATPASIIAIEKSLNLTNWAPKAVISTPDEPKAFYRLRVGQ